MTDDEQRARELLPCPFCGSNNVRLVEIVDDEGDSLTAVGCEGCGCNGAPHIPLMDDARPAAISSWNRRAAQHVTLDAIRIPAADGLDPITVYADDLGEGHGRLTVCCYADSWSYTAGWGAMGGSLHRFIADLNPHYLADNLLWPNAAKARKDQRQYVERIAAAVIAAFAARPQGVKDVP